MAWLGKKILKKVSKKFKGLAVPTSPQTGALGQTKVFSEEGAGTIVTN